MHITRKKDVSKQFGCVFAGFIPACLTLAVLVLTGSNVRGNPVGQTPLSATQNPADANCVVDAKLYRDYIVGLGDVVHEVYTACQVN